MQCRWWNVDVRELRIAMPSEKQPTETKKPTPTEQTPAASQPPKRKRRIRRIVFVVAHILGFLSSYDALMSTRTSQGAIAWIISLNTLPIVSVPAYWVLGRSKFEGYVTARRQMHDMTDEQREQAEARFRPYIVDIEREGSGALAGSGLAEMPYLRGNDVDLLIDGEATFASIMDGIDAAEEYILVQFYIVRDDELGRELKQHLLAKASAGVKVWFMYDEIGTRGLDTYWKELRDAGVVVNSFHSTRGPSNRFQLNFRNHRKIVVVDGKVGWVGGHNVGDEYMGRDPDFPNWRDTHVRIAGPAALELQLSFLEDWRWATNDLLKLDWTPHPADEGDATVLIVPTGPADRLETCSLLYQQAIHGAKKRVWIASPYFVPDEGVTAALQLAALRGVDVKVIIPETCDNAMVYYAAYAFVDELMASGIEVHRYQPGFMHQKVFLVDDKAAGIGTANFDNRSFRLNFEVTAIIHQPDFLKEVEAMLLDDLSNSIEMTIADVENKPWWFQALSRASFLTAPVQ